jgi:hypothetical protein
VASEVKTLANRTAKATEEITGIQISAAVEEQSASTPKIARSLQQAAQGTNDVSSNIAHASKAADDTGVAASEVLGLARDLSKQSETLRSELDRFLSAIRTASVGRPVRCGSLLRLYLPLPQPPISHPGAAHAAGIVLAPANPPPS